MHYGKAVGGQFSRFRSKIVFVVPVGDKHHGRLGPGLEILPYRGGYGYDYICFVQHFLLHAAVSCGDPGQQPHVLEIVHLRPGIAEIRNPADSGFPVQFQSYKVHGMRRSGSDNSIHGVVIQILGQEAHGWLYPAGTRVGEE